MANNKSVREIDYLKYKMKYLALKAQKGGSDPIYAMASSGPPPLPPPKVNRDLKPDPNMPKLITMEEAQKRGGKSKRKTSKTTKKKTTKRS
jgi:hypothetical protein